MLEKEVVEQELARLRAEEKELLLLIEPHDAERFQAMQRLSAIRSKVHALRWVLGEVEGEL